MLNVDETFNMAQALCTSALEASYVNRLNVFFLINYKKPRHLLDVSADIILYREVSEIVLLLSTAFVGKEFLDLSVLNGFDVVRGTLRRDNTTT